nr:unnamed protein product [Digitaria exilis]
MIRATRPALSALFLDFSVANGMMDFGGRGEDMSSSLGLEPASIGATTFLSMAGEREPSPSAMEKENCERSSSKNNKNARVQPPPGFRVKKEVPSVDEVQEEEASGGRAAMAVDAAAAAKAEVVVRFDKDMLHCPLCTLPLKPPIFQCGVGHLACGSCHGQLSGNQCHSCDGGGPHCSWCWWYIALYLVLGQFLLQQPELPQVLRRRHGHGRSPHHRQFCFGRRHLADPRLLPPLGADSAPIWGRDARRWPADGSERRREAGARVGAAYGCGASVSYYQAAEHGAACPYAPCDCAEPGCGFVGSPPSLLAHLTAAPHSWPVDQVQYGETLRLRVPEHVSRHLLFAEEEDGLRVVVLAVGDHGARAVPVTVACVRARGAAGPQYTCKMWTNGAKAPATGKVESVLVDMEVPSAAAAGGAVVADDDDEEAMFLAVPRKLRRGASRQMLLSVRIDRVSGGRAAVLND